MENGGDPLLGQVPACGLCDLVIQLPFIASISVFMSNQPLPKGRWPLRKQHWTAELRESPVGFGRLPPDQIAAGVCGTAKDH